MVVATACFSAMHATVRFAAEGLHPFEVAFFRNLFGLLVIAPVLAARGLGPLRTRRIGLHLVRAGLNVVAMLAFFTALTISPLAQVQSLGFTAPLFATALAALALGERVGASRWVAVVAGFAGALLIVRPGIQAVDAGALLALGSAAVWGGVLLIIKRLAATDSAFTITGYMVLLMTPLSLVPAIPVWVWPDAVQLGWLLACGLLGTVAQMLMTQSLRLADASAVLPLDFLKVVWGALIGLALFGELIDGWTWVGAAVIFVGATYLTLSERGGSAGDRG